MSNTAENAMGRRTLLKAMGASAVVIGAGGMTSIRPAEGLAAAGSPGTGTDTVIVTVFLRGAVDGLNVFAPIGDNDYHTLRKNIRLTDAVPVGDGFFGASRDFFAGGARRLFEEGDLAVVHAAGSPASTRSHFSAMDNMDLALGPAGSAGWLEAGMSASGNASDVSAFGIGVFPNRSLIGPNGARPVVPSINAVANNRVLGAKRRSNLLALHKSDPWFGPVTAKGLVATDAVLSVTPPNPYPYLDGPAAGFADAAAIINADIGVRAVTLDLGGWDHHTNEDVRLPPMLHDLGNGLFQFWSSLQRGPSNARQRTVVVVMSEFGRTAAENGANGTDHGHGNCMMVLGERVNGGKVHLRNGQWPGLNDLHEGQDLRITTDFRDVFSEVLRRQYGEAAVAPALSGYVPTAVGLFAQPLISAVSTSVSSRGDLQIEFGWGGEPPVGAVRTVVSLMTDGEETLQVFDQELTKPAYSIYKERLNDGVNDPDRILLNRHRSYVVRLAWEYADGSRTDWSSAVVPAWT